MIEYSEYLEIVQHLQKYTVYYSGGNFEANLFADSVDLQAQKDFLWTKIDFTPSRVHWPQEEILTMMAYFQRFPNPSGLSFIEY